MKRKDRKIIKQQHIIYLIVQSRKTTKTKKVSFRLYSYITSKPNIDNGVIIVYFCTMRKISIIIFLLFSLFFGSQAIAQKNYLANGLIVDNDTIANLKLPTYYVVTQKKFKSKRQKKRYTRLVRYVKKVYPYAKIAGQKLQDYDSLLRAAPNDRTRKKIMKIAEKEIRAEYEGKLRNFTIGQGKILVKLIDRETNHSSYHLLKELKGSVSAFLWQGAGRLFGYNLKVKYDPKGKDKNIEQIIRLIDIGAI